MNRKLFSFLLGVVACASTFSISQHYINKQNEKPTIPTIQAERPTPTETPTPEPVRKYYKVSYYDQSYCDRYSPRCITASGEKFVDSDFTCACGSDFALGTVFRVTYKENSVITRCNDRGAFESIGRTLDLSKASFEALAPISKGVLSVEIEVIRPEYDKLNEYRQNQGLPKLSRNEALEESAYESAKDIYEGKREWSHEGYEKYINDHSKGWRNVGENLARGYSNFDKVLSSWHLSDKHRAIIQSEKYTDFGIGNYKSVWVLHVGGKK